ncbi:MAG TPA: hypothetical protein VK467_12540 [Gemmatimonadales bacterium]|nr:hypothetical protein [Gemmatimonadales bacterium]
MLHRILIIGALAAAAASTACSDRTPLSPPGDAALAASAKAPQKPEKLTREFAKALENPAFRAYVKAQLDASPFREHKLQFQTFLGANGRRALRYLEQGAEQDAQAAVPLEIYFPVPAHRAAWTGDENVLVATGITDRDVPIAFDPEGGRHLLDPTTPPETPVIALVPVETDFSAAPALQTCVDCGGSGDVQPPPPPPPGLYMTKAHFVQDFEGWLKGAPEFEVHILGQVGQTDSLTTYQCAGERQYGPYFFNQDNLDWSGRVLLFSKQQLDQYNAAHPGQNVRVFVVEDDDTACDIKTDPDRFQKIIYQIDSAYQRLTTGNDSSTALRKYFGYGRAVYNIWQSLASFFKSNDELVGNAVQDVIVGQLYDGYNWFVKGENTITNGWINLVMY